MVLVAAGIAAVPAPLHADELTVPVELQVDLVGRIARYERGFAGRAREPAVIVVLERPRNPESQRVAAQLQAALSHASEIGGRPVRVARHEYTGADALRTELDRSAPAIVYTAPGLGRDMATIARTLAGRSILSISSVGADVERGAVVSFELVASRPQISIHLGRARDQRLQFSAQLLRLARVVQ